MPRLSVVLLTIVIAALSSVAPSQEPMSDEQVRQSWGDMRRLYKVLSVELKELAEKTDDRDFLETVVLTMETFGGILDFQPIGPNGTGFVHDLQGTIVELNSLASGLGDGGFSEQFLMTTALSSSFGPFQGKKPKVSTDKKEQLEYTLQDLASKLMFMKDSPSAPLGFVSVTAMAWGRRGPVERVPVACQTYKRFMKGEPGRAMGPTATDAHNLTPGAWVFYDERHRPRKPDPIWPVGSTGKTYSVRLHVRP